MATRCLTQTSRNSSGSSYHKASTPATSGHRDTPYSSWELNTSLSPSSATRKSLSMSSLMSPLISAEVVNLAPIPQSELSLRGTGRSSTSIPNRFICLLYFTAPEWVKNVAINSMSTWLSLTRSPHHRFLLRLCNSCFQQSVSHYL